MNMNGTLVANINQVILRRTLAGETPEVIAVNENLPVNTVKKVIASPLFQTTLTRKQSELTERTIDDIADKRATQDPIVQRLRNLVPAAINRLAEEMDNHDPELGANANTRISAAKYLVEMEGSYAPKRDLQSSNNAVIINFSTSKLELVQRRAAALGKTINIAPDSLPQPVLA